MEIKDILIRLLPGMGDESRQARCEDGVMVVECGGCGDAPDPSSDRCIGCMVRNLASCGPADEVVLRNGNDLGVCGGSGRFLSEAASLMRWSVPDPPADRACSGCSLSPDKVMGRAWEDFPGDSIGYARDMLDWECPEREGCDACRESTRRSLDSLESDLRELASRMVSP
jgi:hypothetical protein